ncbi:cytosolic phospholipase A2-like [Mizuhopecten yessoensis]|uniref:Phospholipase A2 n=1 Tax=Mizuhopecten yessoensis TaxID=6573 RepID=A0A210QK02_MIZYE|nr:cytosolic phospholipase A2-like [Mizuhopecten yessoensis]XP_021356302.1 cytosolic phospholipase A2-like [Mizuhopecten yessoensis]OWF49078.1 Cytosolic phospholipase A2 [Mizuhopecten yessoensis]
MADMTGKNHEKHKCKELDNRSQHVQTYKPNLRQMEGFEVNVKKATGLHNGWYDKLDVPDSYVEVHCQQTVEKLHTTEVHWNDRNPVFNETKTFTLTQDTQDNPDIKIMVKEKNTLIDGVHGEYTCELRQPPKEIQLNQSATLSVDISCKQFPSNLRSGSELCQGEEDFRRARCPVVRRALQKLFGHDKTDLERLPVIAVLGSGGGFRAMMGMSGVYKGLVDTGILDCVTYTVGLSGTAWYLSTLCSNPDWPDVHPSVVDDHLRKCVGKSLWDTIMSLRTFRNCYDNTKDCGKPWTFTDLFGYWVGQTLIPDTMHTKWSHQQNKVRDGHCPLPILACVHAKLDKSVKEFHEWVEISPFEVHMPKYATSVKLEEFGSEFYKGRMTVGKNELPLHFLMGICGSAFTALHKSFSEMAAKSKKLSSSSRGSEGDWNTTDTMDEDLSSWIDFTKGILDKFGMNYLDSRCGRAAKIPNFMRQLTLVKLDEVDTPTDSVFTTVDEPMSTKEDHMCLIDAGLVYNSPYPLILRPERQVDLILSFEFSDRGKDDSQPFEQLLLAKQWADDHRVPFPPINIEQYKDKPVQELYAFQDEADPNCPIILHFVLVNNHFRHQYKQGTTQTEEDRKFADFSIFDDGTYDSINFEFTENQFLRISKLMEFNVHHSLDMVKEYIKKAIGRREGPTTSPS